LLLFAVVVAAVLSAPSTLAGVVLVLERYSPAPPAACGLAIDVPDMVVVPPFTRVDKVLTPGAQTSTQLP
jgi:hypothetical protein